MEAFADLKEKLNVPFLLEIIILAAWSIWIVRNNKIFKNSNPTIASWEAVFYYELIMVKHRMKKNFLSSVIGFMSYLDL
jgi:hypothetical protein